MVAHQVLSDLHLVPPRQGRLYVEGCCEWEVCVPRIGSLRRLVVAFGGTANRAPWPLLAVEVRSSEHNAVAAFVANCWMQPRTQIELPPEWTTDGLRAHDCSPPALREG